MGKPNAPMNIKNKTKNNYFTQAVQRGGKDFIETTNIQQLQNDATRIFRDIAKGSVDLSQCQQYLLNDRLANVLEQQASQTLLHDTTIFNCINYTIGCASQAGQQIDPYVVSILEEYRCRVSVYQIIVYNIQNFRVTKDINFIVAMAAQIGNNRRYI